MKKIIAGAVCGLILVSSTQAWNIVDAIKTNNTKECLDKQAENYKALAPCMYIVRAPKVTTYTQPTYSKPPYTMTSDQPTTIYNMNNPSSYRVGQLVDTSVIYRNAQNNLTTYQNPYNGMNLVDTSRLYQLYKARNENNYHLSLQNGIAQLVDTSVLGEPTYVSVFDKQYNYLAPTAVTLPTWFSNGFGSAQSIGNIVLYGKNNQYLAINHSSNKIIFETQANQSIKSAFTGSNGQVIITTTSTTASNSQSLYLISSEQKAVIATGLTNIFYMSKSNSGNTWKEDVIITVSQDQYNLYTWNYAVLNYDGKVLAAGVTDNNITALEQTIIKKEEKPVVIPVKPTPTKPTATPAKLTYSIAFELGETRKDGYMKLEDARCNTNGTVDVLWIEKRTGDNSFGLGIEINNTFKNQTYHVKKGDKICCRVSNVKVNYSNTAAGCTEIK